MVFLCARGWWRAIGHAGFQCETSCLMYSKSHGTAVNLFPRQPCSLMPNIVWAINKSHICGQCQSHFLFGQHRPVPWLKPIKMCWSKIIFFISIETSTSKLNETWDVLIEIQKYLLNGMNEYRAQHFPKPIPRVNIDACQALLCPAFGLSLIDYSIQNC